MMLISRGGLSISELLNCVSNFPRLLRSQTCSLYVDRGLLVSAGMLVSLDGLYQGFILPEPMSLSGFCFAALTSLVLPL